MQLIKKDGFSDDRDHILKLLSGFSVATGAGGPPLDVFFDLPPSWVQLQTFDPIKEINMATTLYLTMPRYGKIRPVTGHNDCFASGQWRQVPGFIREAASPGGEEEVVDTLAPDVQVVRVVKCVW